MNIGIIGSMQLTEKMLEVREQLQQLGHQAFVTDLHKPFLGKSDQEKEIIKIHQKNNQDAIREFWRKMQGADAVLVLNLDKNGIKNYIGGNTLMEMGFAHVLNQQIYLYNPIPDIPFYKTEIEAMKPVVIDGNLKVIESPLPSPKISNEHLQKTISFLKEIEQLKHVERAIMTSKLQRYENSAEHSWHMAIFVMLLHGLFPACNTEKMLKMALIHDLVEVYAGDTLPFVPEQKNTQAEREKVAATRLFSQLPFPLDKEFMDLFSEFEAQQTKEAKIVHSCDKLQAMMQNVLTDGKAYKGHHLGPEWIEWYNRSHMLHDETILRIYKKLFQEIVEKKMTWQGDTLLNP